jgi:hypothetical protein
MKGPSARRLMGEGEKIFPNIAEYIKTHIRQQQDSQEDLAVDLIPLQIAEDDKIDAVCKDHGILFVLLAAIFSLLNTPIRGKATKEVIGQLDNWLSGILTEWYQLGLCFTPKFHDLLNHSICQVQQMRFHDMDEDCIKRLHQYRMWHEARLMRLWNKGLKMNLQAKFQGMKYIKSIRSIQAAVTSNRKRKLTHKVPLADKQKVEKKAKRDMKCTNVWEIKQVEAPGKQVPAPRELVKMSLKDQQE